MDKRLLSQFEFVLELYFEMVGRTTFTTTHIRFNPDAMELAIKQMREFISGTRNEFVTDESLDRIGEGVIDG